MKWLIDIYPFNLAFRIFGVNNFDGGLYLSFEESEVEHDAVL